MRTLAARDYASIGDCIAAYLQQQALPAPRDVAFGIATAVDGRSGEHDQPRLVVFDRRLARALGAQRVRVLNDFEALAHAVPVLGAADLRAVGGGTPMPGARWPSSAPARAWACRAWSADGSGGWRVIVGEGGHVTLAAASAREASLLAVLRERFGHVSAERALSGPGLVNLYEAACVLDGETAGHAGAGAGDGAQPVGTRVPSATRNAPKR